MLNIRSLTILVSGLLLTGCGGSLGGSASSQSPRVRVFNGVDGQSTIAVAFKDANLNVLGTSPNAQYGSVTTDTLITNTTATATINGASGALATTAPFLYRSNSYYSVYAFGPSAQVYGGLVVTDSQAVAASTTFGVRAVELGTKNPAVDVYVEPGSAALSATNLIFSNLAYGTATTTSNTTQAVDSNGYILTPVNSSTLFTVYVTVHGSTTPIASATVTVVPGAYYTVAVYDSETGATSPTSAVVVSDRRD